MVSLDVIENSVGIKYTVANMKQKESEGAFSKHPESDSERTKNVVYAETTSSKRRTTKSNVLRMGSSFVQTPTQNIVQADATTRIEKPPRLVICVEARYISKISITKNVRSVKRNSVE